MPSTKPPKRGEISEFSEPSRRRFLELLATLKRDAQPIFLTLTYPDTFPTYREDFKRHLELFWHRLTRRWPEASALWKLEFQTRKSGENKGKIAQHYHLIVYGVPDHFPFRVERRPAFEIEKHDLTHHVIWTETAIGKQAGYVLKDDRWLGAGRNVMAGEEDLPQNQDKFERWVSRTWYDVVGSGDLRHYKAGTRVERIRKFKQLCGYAAKRYMAKKDVVPGLAAKPGRFWGVMGRANLPAVPADDISITEDQAHRVRRAILAYRKSIAPAEKRGKLRFPKEREFTLSLFCDADFWSARLPAIMGTSDRPPRVDTIFADRIRWGEQEIIRRSRTKSRPRASPLSNGVRLGKIPPAVDAGASSPTAASADSGKDPRIDGANSSPPTALAAECQRG